MGWLRHTTPCSKRDFIKDVIRDFTNDTSVAKCDIVTKTVRGNCLWMVGQTLRKDTGEIKKYILLCLIDRYEGCWGYKDMDEGMHPYFYSCPLAYLAMVPEENAKWREGVRAYHTRRSVKVTKGKCYTLKNTKACYQYVQIDSVRPLRGYVNGNWLARVSRRCIGEEIANPYQPVVEALKVGNESLTNA